MSMIDVLPDDDFSRRRIEWLRLLRLRDVARRLMLRTLLTPLPERKPDEL